LGTAEPEGPKATVQATVPMIRPGSRAVRKEREANASAAKLITKRPSGMNYDDDYEEDDFSNGNDLDLQQNIARENERSQLYNKKA
jgi:hypothetical protein